MNRMNRPINLTERDVKAIVAEAVRETLIELGIAHDDPLEMQKDFQHLREWRLASEMVRRKGLMTMISILAAGILAAFWVGLKQFLAN